MEGSDDGFSSTQKKGGRKNPKMKQHKETILVTAVQAAENKKKKKQQNAGFMYGNVADEEEKTAQTDAQQTQEEQQEEPRETKVKFEEPDREEKGGKGKKHQGKKGQKKGGKGKNAQDSEEEEVKESQSDNKAQEETKQVEQEEEKKESESEFPLKVVYCKICDVPPEYCMVDKKDFTDCINWLKAEHPDLFEELYDKETCKESLLKTHPLMYAKIFPEEEGKTEETKDQPPQKQQKQKKKVGFGTANQEVKIYKTRRGGKKVICSVTGLQGYGVNLKDTAKSMSKKFACSAAVTTDDKYGECIQVQGDIQERFFDFLESDLSKYKIPANKVVFEEIKKKKAGATTGPGGAGQEGGDDQE